VGVRRKGLGRAEDGVDVGAAGLVVRSDMDAVEPRLDAELPPRERGLGAGASDLEVWIPSTRSSESVTHQDQREQQPGAHGATALSAAAKASAGSSPE
jgi:hypothetical protein